jgi:hypothetical protein
MNKVPPFSFTKTHGYVNLCVFFIKNLQKVHKYASLLFFLKLGDFWNLFPTGFYNSDPVYMIIEPRTEWKIGPES